MWAHRTVREYIVVDVAIRVRKIIIIPSQHLLPFSILRRRKKETKKKWSQCHSVCCRRSHIRATRKHDRLKCTREKIPLFQEDDDVENDDGYFVFFVFPFVLLVRFVPFFSLAHRHTQNTFWCRQSLLSVCKWKVSRGVDGEHSTFSVSIFFRFVRFFLFTFEKRSRTTLCVCSIFSSAARQCISFSFILFSFLINGSVVRWIGIKAKFHCISLMETSASVSARKRERSRFVCVILSLKEICSHRCAHQKF